MDIFAFISAIISFLTTTLTAYLLCIHKKIRVIIASLVFHQVKEIGTIPGSSVETNSEEDWDSDHQKQFQPPQQPLAQCLQTQNYQKPQSFQRSKSQTFDVPDRYLSQQKLHRQWEEEMERLNNKYGLDRSSDSEFDSESDEGRRVQIWT